MHTLRICLVLSLFCCGSAAADIWKWIDSNGESHFVSTNTAIYTWVENEKVFYSDTPDHEDAVLVQLIWHSKGTLKEPVPDDGQLAAAAGGDVLPTETPAERAEREAAEAHRCKRITEIYKSYENAPRLYRSNAKGEREYLSPKEAQSTMADAKEKMDEACQHAGAGGG